MKLTRRCARITHERATKLLAIINQLRVGIVRRDEMEALICLSPSGTTKYVEDLLDHQIMCRVKDSGNMNNVVREYRLSDDDARVAEFVRLITLPGLDGLPRHRGRNISPEDGTRKVHIAKDDEPIKVKLGAKQAPKQIDLVLYLFGMVPAEGLLS